MKVAMKVLSVLAAGTLLLTACSSKAPESAQQAAPSGGKADSGSAATSSASNDDLAYKKYDQPVTLNIGFSLPETNKLASGDTNDNNPASRYLESLTNIKVVHTWEAKGGSPGSDPFSQKVNLAIASNDLPDAVVVDRNMLRKMADNDMLADLTDVYNKYGSKLVKDIYASTKGKALQDATFNGKLLGLPNVAIDADSPSLLWIRKDWLTKLNLPEPKTLDDIEKIAKAFKDQDPDGNGKPDTVGLTGDKAVVWGQKPNASGLDAVFDSFHAFPRNWIKDKDGNVVYGSITPENKQALAKLQIWYKDGLIDQEFALRKSSTELIVSNKTGMFFGPWWAPYFPLGDALTNDTKAEWIPVLAPADASGKFVTHMAPVTDRYLVVRKGYKNPEAVVKELNAFTRLERNQDPNKDEVKKLVDYETQTGVHNRSYYPFDLLLDYADAVVKRNENVHKALDGQLDPKTLDADTKQVYDFAVKDKENPKKDINAWKASYAFLTGGDAIKKPMDQVYSVFYGTTKTMETKWSTLEKMENETFLKIIMNQQSVDTFDDFVKQWKSLGGDQITKEVADIVAKSK